MYSSYTATPQPLLNSEHRTADGESLDEPEPRSQEASIAAFAPAHVDRGGPPHRYDGGPLEVSKVHVGPWENNAYLLRDPDSDAVLLVDAADEAERLLALLGGGRVVGVVR